MKIATIKHNIGRFKLFLIGFFVIFAMLTQIGSIQNLAYATTPVQLQFADEAVDKLPNVTAQSANQANYSKTFAKLIGQILRIVMAVAGLALLIMLLWGGISWITSGGDKSKAEEARSRITTAVIGMIVLAAAYALLLLVLQILGFTNLTGLFSNISSLN